MCFMLFLYFQNLCFRFARKVDATASALPKDISEALIFIARYNYNGDHKQLVIVDRALQRNGDNGR